ncbi:hypothetical protein [Deinococcus sp. 12RED42]|uniref:hypothetical protein n=1 Tax=Deinococcus sp. 12RED42 TaxID=2745872 RepID=UPI001E516455|nr:hypothetical protein [Deinococcus sp. 12RED42]MCD0164985.1 hypothetical protein [Deinococcus sp. 12RED42]
MRAALISKSPAEKAAFAQAFVAGLPRGANVIHLHPANRAPLDLAGHPSHAATYEDLTKTDVWLRVNNLLGTNTALLLENPSRYPKISSDKVRHLRRLSMQVQHAALVDIVPFTLAPEYVYTPFSLLGRDILGYAHYYAFRENYHERTPDGRVVRAHDPAVLAAKLAPVTRITHPAFLEAPRDIVPVTSTPDEAAAYAVRKDELFDSGMPVPKIITRLADTAHAHPSRTQAALGHAAALPGPVLALTNLGSYAADFQRAARAAGLRHVTATSYATATEAKVAAAAHVLILEAPIIKSYLLLDVESWLTPGATVTTVRGDMGVDRHLWDLMDSELTAIDALTRELYAART